MYFWLADIRKKHMDARNAADHIILRTRGLSRRYGGLWALKDLDLEVRVGQILGIIGPNGAGKTTLLNLLAGYVRPTAGSIEFDGRRIETLKPYELCQQGIGRTFQIVQPFMEMSVFDNVLTGALFSSGRVKPRKIAEQICVDVLLTVGLQHKSRYLAGTLSIGEKKRLELAKALATQPRLLMLDEVMSGLTGKEVDETMNVIRNVNSNGVTVIMIEHLIKAVLQLADEVCVINFGTELYKGNPVSAFENEEVITAYIGRRPTYGVEK
jgi:branched-chain amino acid transport system ATP-binding protein